MTVDHAPKDPVRRARPAPARLGAADANPVLALQRGAGNRAVAGVLQRQTPAPAPAAGVDPAPPPAPATSDISLVDPEETKAPEPQAPKSTPAAADPPGSGFAETLGNWPLFPKQVFTPPGSPWKWDAGKEWEFPLVVPMPPPLPPVTLPVKFEIGISAMASLAASFGPGSLSLVRIRRPPLEQAVVATQTGPLPLFGLHAPVINAKGRGILSVPAAAGGRVRVVGIGTRPGRPRLPVPRARRRTRRLAHRFHRPRRRDRRRLRGRRRTPQDAGRLDPYNR